MPWDSRDETKKKARVAAGEAAMAQRHREWDLAAKDRTMKYERPSFAVVGEGNKESQDLYRRNYELIDWSQKPLAEDTSSAKDETK